MTWFGCPDGHSFFRCAHPELAQPVLGRWIMIVGALNVLIYSYILLRG